MKHKYFPILVIIVGMILTHLFFSLLIYRSNLQLHQNVSHALDAGYLAVPNARILPDLRGIGTAFKGALFFTLTIGIVLPFLVYLAAWSWDRGYRRGKAFLIMLSGFVIFCMVMLNRNGFNPIVTFWFLAVYFTVFKLTLRSLDGVKTRLSPRQILTHLVVLLCLAASWLTALSGSNFFLSVRDHFLLQNQIGNTITDFYYRYAPYPSEACKPFTRKQLKTCRIEGNIDNSMLQRIESVLLHYNCLPIDTDADTDFSIHALGDKLSFSVAGRTIFEVGISDFIKKPADFIKRLSSRSDRHDFTRSLLAFSLLYGLPIFFYACLFSLFQLIFRLLPIRVSGFLPSAVGCLIVGIGALIIFKAGAPGSLPISHLKTALSSTDIDIRIAALRTIAQEDLDPSDYIPHAFSDTIEHVPERIWWTVSLGNSPKPEANEVLLHLLDDPHPLVASKAYKSLGKKNYRPAIDTIAEKIRTSRHWYVQGTAYIALRTLGWKQQKST
jgi:Ca2+/Na+ antiporter